MVKTLLNISKHGTEEKEDGLVVQSGMNEVKHETSILIRFLFGYVQFKFYISLHCVLCVCFTFTCPSHKYQWSSLKTMFAGSVQLHMNCGWERGIM